MHLSDLAGGNVDLQQRTPIIANVRCEEILKLIGPMNWCYFFKKKASSFPDRIWPKMSFICKFIVMLLMYFLISCFLLE